MKKLFIIVGSLHIPSPIVYDILRETFGGRIGCWFFERDHRLQAQFTFANCTGKKVEAIFVGPVPHKTFAAGKESSMVAEVNIANSPTPVYVCRNKSGQLKITKTSFTTAAQTHHQRKLAKQAEEEERKIHELEDFIRLYFPNCSLFEEKKFIVF